MSHLTLSKLLGLKPPNNFSVSDMPLLLHFFLNVAHSFKVQKRVL